jgi:transposase InsO family protein
MLTEEELKNYFDARGLAEAARALIRRLRATQPARAVGGTRRANSTAFASRKMGLTIQAESLHGEEVACWLWEHDPDTYEYWDQPPSEQLSTTREDGRCYKYLATFDYFVLARDFCGWVEIKRREEIERLAANGDRRYALGAEGRWHYLPGEERAREMRLDFELRLVEDTNPVLAANVRFLASYLRPDAPAVAATTRGRILERVRSGGWHRVADLVQSAEVPWTPDDVFALIAARHLHFRLDADRLSDYEHVYAFADANAAAAFELARRTECAPLAPVPKIAVEHGSRWTLYSSPWTVVDRDHEGVALVSGDGTLTRLKWPAIHALLESRDLHGDVPVDADDTPASRIAQRLRTATASDRDLALLRWQALFPDSGQPPPDRPVPARTLRHWRQLYRDGQRLYGNGFIALLPRVSGRGNRSRRLQEAALEIVQATIRDKFLSAESPTRKSAWGHCLLRLAASGLPAISRKAFSREIKRLATACEQAYSRAGRKEAYQVSAWYWRLDETTPRHGQRPWEVAHIDHTQLDLQLLDPRFRRTTRKVWATALIDGNSRLVLAVVLSFDRPRSEACMRVLRECLRRFHRVPETVVVDHGKEFRSTCFVQLLAYLEISVRYRPPGSPRHGAVIERLFRRWNDDFIHNVTGNNQALQRPRSMAASHDPRQVALWTLDDFEPVFKKYLHEIYAKELVHEALGVTPQQAYDVGMHDGGLRPHCLIEVSADMELMFLPLIKNKAAKVHPGGRIQVGSIDYHCSDLESPQVEGTKVPVRYDPDNAARVYVLLKRGWVEAFSSYRALFERYTAAEISRHTRELRDRLGTGRRARAANAATLARFLLAIELREHQLAAVKAAQRADEPQRLAFLERSTEFKRLLELVVNGGQLPAQADTATQPGGPPPETAPAHATSGSDAAPPKPFTNPSAATAADGATKHDTDPFADLAVTDFEDFT